VNAKARLFAALLALAAAGAGCNAIFGIVAGQAGGGCLAPRQDSCTGAQLTDPANCCGTGRSCQGGTCTAGECGPVPVASTPNDEVVEVAVAGDSVVWSSGMTRKIYATSISKADGVVSELGSAQGTSFQNISAIAVGGDYVYFGDYASPGIGRIPVAGGSVEIVVKGDPSWVPPNPIGHPQLVVSGGFVYFAAEGAGIFRAPITGSLPATAQQVAVTSPVYTVAIDDTYVYWDDNGTQMIARLPIAQIGTSAQPEFLVPDQNLAGGLVVDADSVIWSTQDGVFLTAKEGANRKVTTLTTMNDSSTNEVFTDGRDVFFTTTAYAMGQAGGRVRRVSKAGGPVVDLAANTSMFGMGGITATCDTLFWLDGGSLSLMKATK
jgi:hypothetical protein